MSEKDENNLINAPAEAMSEHAQTTQPANMQSQRAELIFTPESKELPEKLPEKPPEKKNIIIKTIEEHTEITFPKLKSIRFNLWITFVMMTVIMLAIMWLYELLFYTTLHITIQENETKVAAQTISDRFKLFLGGDGSDFGEYLDEFSYSNNMNIMVFYLDENQEIKAAYSATAGTGLAAGGIEGAIKDHFLETVRGYDISYVFNTANDTTLSTRQMVIGGRKTYINGTVYYFFLSVTLPAFDQTRNTLVSQLAVISAICLVISVVVAYIGSGFAARPVRDLAIKVSSGRYDKKREPLSTDTGLAEIDELSESFNKAMDEVENNNRFRRDLLANVSHDMRTPLTMIKAYSEMIRDISGGNKEKCAKNAQVIIDETDRLSSLVSEVIELSKLESGVIELNPSVFDLSEKIEEVVKRFSIMKESGYKFVTEIESDIAVMADSEKIDRVLYNLIGNALNYSGVDKTVFVKCYIKDKIVRVDVCDSGKGMTQEELSYVWDKYYRLAQDKRRVIGSGLGLSIVKAILELHNTTFGVESIKGEGSIFWFTFPVVAAKKKQALSSLREMRE